MALAHNPRIVTESLQWSVDPKNEKSYSGSGSTVNDLIGSVNMTIDNATYNSDGYFSVTSNGGNLETLVADISYTATDGITLEAWIQRTGQGTSRQRILECESSTSGTATSHALIFETDNTFLVWVENSTGGRTELNSGVTIGTGTWHQLVLTCSNSTGLKAYIDGVEKNSTSVSLSGLIPTNYIWMGAISDLESYSHTDYDLHGYMSINRIYNKALTADEVYQNFNATRGRFGI